MTRSSHTDAKEMISDIERLTPDLCAIGDDNFRYRTSQWKPSGPAGGSSVFRFVMGAITGDYAGTG